MVRLKDKIEFIDGIIPNEFQFHYGSVKSAEDYTGNVFAKAFQFHYGSVKSGEYDINTDRVKNFNSTMVRLKEKVGNLCKPAKHISIPLWFG